jgi:serine/threonine protein phosphatase PrpC
MNRSRPRTSPAHSRQQAKLRLDCFALTDRGRVRAENEDAFLVDPHQGLFIVSDGMGGHNAGGLASKIVVTLLPALIREHLSRIESLTGAMARNQLKAAVARLSADVRSRTEGVPGLEGIGATVVLALVRGNRTLISHLGDSRAYRYRNGGLELLAKDHSVVQLLVEHGEITRSQARKHPARSQLTRFIGMKGEALADVRCVELHPGDQIFLCSDGLTNKVCDMELFEVFGLGLSSCQVCKRLVAGANRSGGKDNITVVHLAA